MGRGVVEGGGDDGGGLGNRRDGAEFGGTGT